MAACVKPPLVTPKHYDPMFKVDILLREPTLPRTNTSSEIAVDFLSLCTQLDALCKKELVQQPLHKIQNGKTSTSFVDKARVIEDRMNHTIVRDHFRSDSLHDYMDRTGLKRLFPRPAAYLGQPLAFNLELEQSRCDEYVSSLNQLHQLTALCHQINGDMMTLIRPKYLAHQLALLYQCISNLPNGSVLAKYKKNIEDNFKVIKQVMSMEETQDQSLPNDLREWVLELTSQVAELVESLPAQLTQSAALPASILAHLL